MIVEYSETSLRQLKKFDKRWQKEILKEMDEVAKLKNPRERGKLIKGNLSGIWRYRVGDFRILCEIQDSKILITVLRIKHRKEIYE